MTEQEKNRIRELLATVSDELWEIVARDKTLNDDTLRLIVLAEDVGECHASVQRVPLQSRAA